jgi:YD repeat-containing protein
MMTIGGLLAALLIAPAQAAEHPVFLPRRDMAATYVLAAPGRADATYELQYDAAGERARITDPLRGLTVLADLPSGRAELVVAALHAVVEAPEISGLAAQIRDAGGARFLPLGTGRYAGLACDEYEVLAAQGSGTACLTQDGVILHFAGRDAHGAARVTAVSVRFERQPDAFFEVPAGYSRLVLPPGAIAQLLGG